MEPNKPSKTFRQIELELKYGMKIRMECGQRIFSRDPMWGSDTMPPDGSEIYVCRIPRNIFEDVLYPIFSQVGRIIEIRIMMEFSGLNRGFAFIKFANAEMADSAIRKLNGFKIMSSRIVVVKSVNNCTLHLAHLPINLDSAILKSELQKRFIGVTEVTMQNTMAYAKFDTHRNALEARKVMWPAKLELFGHKIWTEWAKPN